MYKLPELSAMAKVLRNELSKANLSVTHAQVMEILAKMGGDRNLHVLQHKSRPALDVEATAVSQAAALMFDTLGRFQGNSRGLIQSVATGFNSSSGASRDIEAAMEALFGQEDSPVISDLFSMVKHEDLPEAFEALVAKLTVTLSNAQSTSPTKESLDPGSIFEGTFQDWRCYDRDAVSDIPVEHRTKFDLKICNQTAGQIYLQMYPQGVAKANLDGKPQMGVLVEINEGRPCVHLTNDIQGDQVVSIFFTEDGLYFRPDGWEGSFESENLRAPGLKKLAAELNTPLNGVGTNFAVIETLNK